MFRILPLTTTNVAWNQKRYDLLHVLLRNEIAIFHLPRAFVSNTYELLVRTALW